MKTDKHECENVKPTMRQGMSRHGFRPTPQTIRADSEPGCEAKDERFWPEPVTMRSLSLRSFGSLLSNVSHVKFIRTTGEDVMALAAAFERVL